MEDVNNTFNVTMQAFHLLSEAYTFCYINLKKANIPIPELNQMIQMTKATVSYLLSNSPTIIGQLYNILFKMVIESNFVGLFLVLVLLYIAYCFVMGTVRWLYRVLYGFVRFTIIILLFAGLMYALHLYHLSTITNHNHATKSYT
ncbi:hypothetical protein BDF20DRAFT_814740 [Mycotypha africana]|uniref:uncharacterized protein n=1 Tax=Mycotypha africana TaxID=64632 RepID=UPI0023018402|nr:uncharacterized protein BDF20DRAFT_814740 [Mycotypha africana]KAI8988311.1 hypothetical protein BDF20DRAFT_814740 [Mycotypha africana]